MYERNVCKKLGNKCTKNKQGNKLNSKQKNQEITTQEGMQER